MKRSETKTWVASLLGRSVPSPRRSSQPSIASYAAISLLLWACSHASKATSPGCCEKAGPAESDDGGADGSLVVTPPVPKPPARFRVEEGCARDFKASGEPGRDMAEIERLCAQGLKPILPASEISRTINAEPVEIGFRVTGSTACVRAGVLGIAPGQILTLENMRGTILATASSQDPLGLVPPDGTVCVREAGTYRLVVKGGPVSSDARTLTVQVWQASHD